MDDDVTDRSSAEDSSADTSTADTSSAGDRSSHDNGAQQPAPAAEPAVEHRAPVVPDNGYSRESYAIHATRSELPLFSDALTDRRDDASWLSSLSGVLAGSDPDAATAAAQAAIGRRRRDRGES